MLDLRDLASEFYDLDQEDEPRDEDDQERYNELATLAVEITNLGEDDDDLAIHFISDAENEPTLIPEEDWKEYVMETATEVGAISEEQMSTWPFTCIDWDHAADELEHDYTSIEWAGTTYYRRAA